jgi:predicted membrane-bound spermidine synthase
MFWFFLFFLISGFCSILYEVVWLRLSMAAFGVTTALTSIVLSVFMAGLGLGSWGSGVWIRKHAQRRRISPLFIYALIELVIGISALVVPYELRWGRELLQRLPESSSFAYYLASGVWIALALTPWCVAMGATIPVGMQAIREVRRAEASRSFSYLYMANVTGAVIGTRVPLFLIELYGFRGTLRIGAICNVALAASAAGLGLWWRAQRTSEGEEAKSSAIAGGVASGRRLLWLLFATGLTSMGMEVVWIRQFTPYLGTVVYAFAGILGFYLAAMTVGSFAYRTWGRGRSVDGTVMWSVLGLFALLPLWAVDQRLELHKILRLGLGVAPFSALLGFVTPMLVDRWSEGDPDRAGRAYAVNVLGCILGPLLAGFVLLPLLNERWSLLLLAAPWLVLGAASGRWISAGETHGEADNSGGLRRRVLCYAVVLAAIVVFAGSRGFEDQYTGALIRRDHTATVIAVGRGRGRTLLVNGIGITALTPITKLMAHLPLAFLDRAPERALVICFGMGTTDRALLSWDIPATAVELVPSVPRVVGYFHADGPAMLRSPKAQVVIDDGRRYLERTSGEFDVITMDPPPPVEAAGSSLLYSKEFYAAVRQRLRRGGILQTWLPSESDDFTRAAVARALKESFPYVRAFGSVEPLGFHFLASELPIPPRSAAELAGRLPARAVTDLLEWGPYATAEAQFAAVLKTEFPLEEWIAKEPLAPALADDRPVNEYYALRRWRVQGK